MTAAPRYVGCYLGVSLARYRAERDGWTDSLKQVLEDNGIDCKVNYDRVLESLPPKLSGTINVLHVDRARTCLRAQQFGISVWDLEEADENQPPVVLE